MTHETQTLAPILRSCIKATVLSIFAFLTLVLLIHSWFVSTPMLYPMILSWLLATVSGPSRHVLEVISGGQPGLLLGEASAIGTAGVCVFFMLFGFKVRYISKNLCRNSFLIAGLVFAGLMPPALEFVNASQCNFKGCLNPAVFVDFLAPLCFIFPYFLVIVLAYLVLSW